MTTTTILSAGGDDAAASASARPPASVFSFFAPRGGALLEGAGALGIGIGKTLEEGKGCGMNFGERRGGVSGVEGLYSRCYLSAFAAICAY